MRPGESGDRVFPAVLGSEASGVVEELGDGVEGFAIGDEVFGNTAAAWATRSTPCCPPR